MQGGFLLSKMNRVGIGLIIVASVLAGSVWAQSRPWWMGMSDAELSSDPFVGVTENGRIAETGLDIHTSGIDVSRVTTTATSFVGSLSDEQRAKLLYGLQDVEWRRWSNIDTYQRRGVKLADMNDHQVDTAWALLNATLSSQGLKEVRSIMHLNLVEGELLGLTARMNEHEYYFTFMGIPSADEPWGFQIDGHHLALNITINAGRITMTPAFFGSEPAVAPQGTTYAGETALQAKQDAGLVFMRSLDDEQRRQAIIAPTKSGQDLVAGAFADNAVIAYEGLRGDALVADQKKLLVELIRTYIGDIKRDAADAWLTAVSAHLDDTWFAWIGGTDDNAVFYYRIYSPALLIEFDHQLPGPLGRHPDYRKSGASREHIHSIVRTPNGGDYGDLLRQHLNEHHRQTAK